MEMKLGSDGQEVSLVRTACLHQPHCWPANCGLGSAISGLCIHTLCYFGPLPAGYLSDLLVNRCEISLRPHCLDAFTASVMSWISLSYSCLVNPDLQLNSDCYSNLQNAGYFHFCKKNDRLSILINL